jgi:hypothetical protein
MECNGVELCDISPFFVFYFWRQLRSEIPTRSNTNIKPFRHVSDAFYTYNNQYLGRSFIDGNMIYVTVSSLSWPFEIHNHFSRYICQNGVTTGLMQTFDLPAQGLFHAEVCVWGWILHVLYSHPAQPDGMNVRSSKVINVSRLHYNSNGPSLKLDSSCSGNTEWLN